MKQQRKVVHVKLIDPPVQYKENYYFGSIAAIYDMLPKEVVGISKQSLWGELANGVYKGRKVIIRREVMHTKDTNRGKERKENKLC